MEAGQIRENLVKTHGQKRPYRVFIFFFGYMRTLVAYEIVKNQYEFVILCNIFSCKIYNLIMIYYLIGLQNSLVPYFWLLLTATNQCYLAIVLRLTPAWPWPHPRLTFANWSRLSLAEVWVYWLDFFRSNHLSSIVSCWPLF